MIQETGQVCDQMCIRGLTLKAKVDKLGSIKREVFCYLKNTIKKVGRRVTEWKMVRSTHIHRLIKSCKQRKEPAETRQKW